MKLSAIPLSIKPGGSARNIMISGGLIAHGVGVARLELDGTVGSLQVTDGVTSIVGNTQP